MALTKKQLKAMGIEDDKIDVIMEGHIESIEALQKKVAAYESNDKPETDAAKNSSETGAKNSDGDTAKDSGDETVNAEIAALKQQIADMVKAAKDKEVKEAKEQAYKALLKDCGVSEKRITAILKVTDFDAVKLNKDGTINNKDDLSENIKSEWADFIETRETKGAETATPPEGEEKKPEPNQSIIARVNQYRANLYGEQPSNNEGG